jgi:uncharacterized protein YyaL (SSP411 family)
LLTNLTAALKEMLPHLAADKAVAIVCSGQTCLQPTSDPAQLAAMLQNGAASSANS